MFAVRSAYWTSASKVRFSSQVPVAGGFFFMLSMWPSFGFARPDLLQHLTGNCLTLRSLERYGDLWPVCWPACLCTFLRLFCPFRHVQGYNAFVTYLLAWLVCFETVCPACLKATSCDFWPSGCAPSPSWLCLYLIARTSFFIFQSGTAGSTRKAHSSTWGMQFECVAR